MKPSISLLAFILATGISAFPIGFGLEVRRLSNPDCSAPSATPTPAVTVTNDASESTVNTAATTGTDGSVLSASTYNDIQISTGTAGNAKAKAAALFSAIDMNNLAGVSASDLKIVQATHDTAQDAETDAFNPAIAASSGAAATALQNGKIANKVLKLTAEVLALQIKQAQGSDKAAAIADEITKLNKNIDLDTKAAGQAMTPVSLAASIP